MKHSRPNGQTNTDKENKMASRIQEGGGGMGSSGSRPRKPIVGIFAPLKMKIVNKDIKSSGGNVKVVASTTNTSRANQNHNSTTGASRAKSGRTAKQSAEFINAQNRWATQAQINQRQSINLDEAFSDQWSQQYS